MVEETVGGNSVARSWELLNTWLGDAITRVIVSIVILLIGFIIGNVVGKLLKRVLHEFELDNIWKKATGVKFSIEDVFSTIIKYIIYFLTVVMALNQLGITTTVLYLISAGLIVILIISLFLGIKDFVPNVLAGLFIHQKRIIHVGDTIKVDSIKGRIVHMNLVETRIKTKEGDLIYLPNTLLTKSPVVIVGKKKKPKK